MKPHLTIPLILLLTSCAPRPLYQPSLTDDGTVITTRVGSQFRIALDTNPTTGYEWKYREDPEGLVRLVESKYDPSHPERIGGGGFDLWIFEGVETGETRITFEYVRACEAGVEPVKKVRYEVRVEYNRISK